MAKVINVGARAEICDSILAGIKGRVVGYDSVENIVSIEVEKDVYVDCPAEYVEQIEEVK